MEWGNSHINEMEIKSIWLLFMNSNKSSKRELFQNKKWHQNDYMSSTLSLGTVSSLQSSTIYMADKV